MDNDTRSGGVVCILLGLVGIALILVGVGVAIDKKQLFSFWVVAFVLGGFVVLTLLLGYNRQRAVHMSPTARRMLYGYNVFWIY